MGKTTTKPHPSVASWSNPYNLVCVHYSCLSSHFRSPDEPTSVGTSLCRQEYYTLGPIQLFLSTEIKKTNWESIFINCQLSAVRQKHYFYEFFLINFTHRWKQASPLTVNTYFWRGWRRLSGYQFLNIDILCIHLVYLTCGGLAGVILNGELLQISMANIAPPILFYPHLSFWAQRRISNHFRLTAICVLSAFSLPNYPFFPDSCFFFANHKEGPIRTDKHF